VRAAGRDSRRRRGACDLGHDLDHDLDHTAQRDRDRTEDTRSIAVVGGGPAGLMAAEILAGAGPSVTVYDRMPSLGRKMLIAGRGGLNLTHSEPLDLFLTRYGTASERLAPALRAFPPGALRGWAEGLGQATFVGSSGRVFPDAFKASPLLRAWLGRLTALGVRFAPRHRFEGFGAGNDLVFTGPDGRIEIQATATLLALGGGSWPRLGSDGSWVAPLRRAGIHVADLTPANCGFRVAWSDSFRGRFAGEPLKRIALSFQSARIRGEAAITQTGIEGGAIYAVSGALRDEIARAGSATPLVDLRPDLDHAALSALLSRPRGKQSTSTFLRKTAGLSPVAINLVREAHGALPAAAPALADAIKAVPLRLTAPMPIERAISSAGGVGFDGIDSNYMLAKCSTGRRQPAATCFRPVSPPALQRPKACWPGWRGTPRTLM
jgi:uncharacterized flavoprotein (TIGR03862 family)